MFGQRHGLAYAVQLRSSFGLRGARIPAAIRALPAIVWYGIGSWIGAMAVAGITQPLFGFGSVPVYFLLFQIFQTGLAYFGIQTIKWFESAMAVVIFAIMGWMMARAIRGPRRANRAVVELSGIVGLAFSVCTEHRCGNPCRPR